MTARPQPTTGIGNIAAASISLLTSRSISSSALSQARFEPSATFISALPRTEATWASASIASTHRVPTRSANWSAAAPDHDGRSSSSPPARFPRTACRASLTLLHSAAALPIASKSPVIGVMMDETRSSPTTFSQTQFTAWTWKPAPWMASSTEGPDDEGSFVSSAVGSTSSA